MLCVSEDIRRTAIEPLKHLPVASRRALVNALNRSVEAAGAEAARAVGDEYPVLMERIRGTIYYTKARRNRLIATVHSRGGATRLSAFPHTPTEPGTGGPGKPPLRAQFHTGRGYTEIRGAFVIPTASFKNAVVWKIPGTEKMRTVPALAVPFMMTNETVLERIEIRAGEMLEDRVAHEVAYELAKAARRAA